MKAPEISDASLARILALLFAVSSFGYQLTIANSITILNDGRILWECLATGFYLYGIGIGTRYFIGT